VAAAALVHQAVPPARCPRAGDGPHQLGHLAGRHPAQRHELGGAGEVREGGGDGRRQLLRPVGADEHQRPRPRLVGDEPQEVHARGVRAVEVVEDDDERRRRRGPAQEPPGGVEDAGPGPGGPGGPAAGGHRSGVRLRRHPRHDGRQLRPGRRREVAVPVEHGPQRLGPRPPGGCQVAVPARAPDDDGALRGGAGGEPGEQRGLADPGLAGDEHEPRPARALAVRRGGERLVRGRQPGQRLGAADEGWHPGIVAP
jgi:hypothetical protein